MQFSCRPHHRSVLARNLPCRVVPALFPPPPFLPPFFLTPPFHYRGNFSRFPIRFPRYTSEIFYTHTHIYVYISVFKTGKWQNSGNSGATSVFCKISRGTKLSGMAITGSPGREIRRIPSTLRAPSRDEILRATYVFVTYVGWPRGPPCLMARRKELPPRAARPRNQPRSVSPSPIIPRRASSLPTLYPSSSRDLAPFQLSLICSKTRGISSRGKGEREGDRLVRRVKDRSRGIGIGLERGSLAWKRRD